MHERDKKQRKCNFFEENSKKICVFEKKEVPLHDFSRGVGSVEPICCVISRKSGVDIQGTRGERYGAIGVRQEGAIGCEKIKYYNKMSKICQITGKKAMGGCNVSHSKRHTKRTFDVNLFRRKFYWVEQDTWIELNVSAAGLRTINKIGLDAALKNAAEKGYLYK